MFVSGVINNKQGLPEDPILPGSPEVRINMPRKFAVLSMLLVIAILVLLLPACKPVIAATGYTAVIPAILQAGSKQTISVNLFAGQAEAGGKVQLKLLPIIKLQIPKSL